jgi:ribosomal protein S27E
MNPRRTGGRETWHRLREWDKGQSESERLAARLLSIEGYEDIDPSHPLGGPDGGKDVLCKKDGRSCVVAAYFPRGQQEFRDITKKFEEDLTKAKELSANGFVFFTNQELILSQRAKLEDSAQPIVADIYHLERIASCLDTPKGYGLRLEFLSIEMTKEEQVSFFNDRDQILYEIRNNVASLIEKRSKADGITTVHVDPQNYFESTSISSIYKSKLVECRNCGEVFRVTRSPMSTMIYSHSSSLETVTCPACGKVQAFHD